MSPPAEQPAGQPRSYLYDRHSLPMRVMHWVNVISLTVLLMSGLMIFNAHPSLDWGKSSYTGRPSVFEITALRTSSGQLIGLTRVFGHQFDTTGVLGVPTGPNGAPAIIAFPSWITIPTHYSLAARRQWHFIVAWLLVAFVAIHVFEVIGSGLWNHLRSMITGRYRITEAPGEART